MNDFTQLVFFLAPALLVAISVYIVLQKMLKNDEMQRNFILMKTSRQATVTMRLQACERLILFLERISPASLVVRSHQQNMDSQDFHVLLLSIVREEFEHNLSQQLYVSNDAWETVRAAKESIIMHINESATKTNAENSSLELARLIVESYAGDGKGNLIQAAINTVKNEAKKIF
jgi:guanylate kinase